MATVKGDNYISDESNVTIGKDVVFSTAPKISGTSESNFYKVLDHSSSMQLRLMPYSQEGGGQRVVFNLEWPQYTLLCDAAKTALTFNIGTWDLAEKIDGAGRKELQRVFGNPVAPNILMQKMPGRFTSIEAATGLCPARILECRRTPIRSDGQVSRYPWYIRIANGYARKLQNASTGGAYMDRKSFVEESSCKINISDAQMYQHTFWDVKLMDVAIQAMGPYVMERHRQFIMQKNQWKAANGQR